MSKTPTTIDLPKAGELMLNCEQELTKLPTDAVHNHLHQLAEKSRLARERLENVELTSIILCAVELDHIKGEPLLRSGSPWKEWVAENCDFSHKTATKYAKVLKCARAGLIDGLDADIIPHTAPSEMSADELQDACQSITLSLQGLGGIRQLYLKLEIIKTPTRCTIDENRNTQGGPKKLDPTAELATQDDDSDSDDISAPQPDLAPPAPELERDDTRQVINESFEKLETIFKQGRHQILPKKDLIDLDNHLQAIRDELKPLIK